MADYKVPLNVISPFWRGSRKVYAVFNTRHQLYFHFYYLNEDYAKRMAEKIPSPTSRSEMLHNWCKDCKGTCQSMVESLVVA